MFLSIYLFNFYFNFYYFFETTAILKKTPLKMPQIVQRTLKKQQKNI